MDAVIAKSRTTWKTNESEETNDDNKILYKPKGETKVLNRQDYIKIIKKSENDKKQEERQEKGQELLLQMLDCPSGDLSLFLLTVWIIPAICVDPGGITRPSHLDRCVGGSVG